MEVPPIEELLGSELYDKVKNLAGLTTLEVNLPEEHIEAMFKELRKGKLTFDEKTNGYRYYVLSIVPTEKEGAYWMTAVPMGVMN